MLPRIELTAMRKFNSTSYLENACSSIGRDAMNGVYVSEKTS